MWLGTDKKAVPQEYLLDDAITEVVALAAKNRRAGYS